MHLSEQITITDPALATKYSQAQKQINDRLKKIAALQKEIAVFKEQIAAVEQAAFKAQQASLKQQQQDQQRQQQIQQSQNQAQTESLKVKEDISFYLVEAEEEDEIEDEDDELPYADEYEENVGDEDEYLFYFKINEPPVTIAKAYKDFDEDRWELSVIEGETNEALENTTFESDFSKLEIINYLAEIYGDVSETYESSFDDKAKLDKQYYEKELESD